ncbi:MAG: hypothetical protein FWB96_12565 [Defluviitaleaceae bacterium]|nr:hypothetical protein [Defluviitaleaceae bacterium]MCL2263958.1 hypothetical protein [Defluviitaleaceae bacterium]
MNEKKKVVARINVRDVRIAFLVTDGSEGATYEDSILIPGTMQIQLAPRVASAALHGDGRARHQENRVSGYDVTFDHNMIPPQVLSKMKGQKYINGIRRSNVNAQPKEFAMGWVVDLIGGVEVTWLPKCLASPSNKNIQQTTDTVNYSTDSLTVASFPLEYNGDYEYIADTTDTESDFNESDVAEFLKTVPAVPPEGSIVPAEDNALPTGITEDS